MLIGLFLNYFYYKSCYLRVLMERIYIDFEFYSVKSYWDLVFENFVEIVGFSFKVLKLNWKRERF